MDQFLLAIIILALGFGAAALGYQIWQAASLRQHRRAAFLDRCTPLFTGVRTGAGATGFVRLGGRHGDQPFDIQILPDTLTFRKLPALWVLVTLPSPLPVRATFDLMIRPTGVEPFSHFNGLSHQVGAPRGFPEDCAIRTDAPSLLPAEAVLRPHLRIFDDPAMKELVISPKGVRLVFLAEEAQRGRYLIFRDSEMGLQPLPPERLQPVLAALLGLRADLLGDPSRSESLSA